MTLAVEVLITKYDYRVSPNPNLGTPIWGRVIPKEDLVNKKRAIFRLERILKSNDVKRHDYILDDTLYITKERKNGPFNQKSETVYKKDISGDEAHKKQQQKAAQRLARYLSKKSDTYDYYCKIALLDIGQYGYCTSQRSVSILDNKDKQTHIVRKISGRKAALRRNINKAKKIRNVYKSTLFPEAYAQDKKFMQIMRFIPDQRKRLSQAKK